MSIETINPSRMKIRDLLNYKIHAPREFQRRVVWDQSVKVKYIQSHNRGNSISTITLVDIPACIEYNKQNNYDVERFQYYHDLGHRYLAIDGQNRIECLRSFYEDRLQIHGRFYDHDGIPVQIGSSLLSNIEAKNPRLHDYFRDLEVIVVTLSKRTWRDLHTLFRDINAGCPLNAMEKRNSLPTPIAPTLLGIAEASYFKNVWSKVSGYKHQKIKRMLDVETVVKAFMITHDGIDNQTDTYLLRNKALNDRSMDQLYEKGLCKQANQVREYSKESVERFANIAELWSSTINMSTNNLHGCAQKLMWSMLYVLEHLYDNGYINQVDDLNCASFADMVRERITTLESQTFKQYSSDLEIYERESLSIRQSLEKASDDERIVLNQRLESLQEPLKSLYFFYRVSNVPNPGHRNDVRDQLTSNLSDLMLKYDLFPSSEFDEYSEAAEA
jgi:hypothetical protein